MYSGCSYILYQDLSVGGSREDKDDGRKSETPTPEVDEEGYCIRPKVDLWENDKGSFYSSSDTDSGRLWCVRWKQCGAVCNSEMSITSLLLHLN
jgi:hypothetical protein